MRRLLVITAAVLLALSLAGVAESQCCPGGVCPPRQQWRAPQAPVTQPAQPTSRPHPAVPRVTVYYGNISHPLAGVLVGKNEDTNLAYVLTAAHAFIRGRTADRITVEFFNGERFLADPRAINHDWDAAVLAIRRPSVTPIILATVAPARGESLTLMGYGQGRWRRFGGGLRGFVSPGQLGIYEFITVQAAATQGDSGGPILNQRGQLVGIISGVDARGVTCGPVCTRLRRLFRAILPPYRKQVVVIKPKQPAPPVPIKPITPADEGPPLPDKPAPELASVQALITKLEIQLAGMKPVPGPRGQIGPQGLPGPVGPQGKAGAVDPKRLPPITVKTIKNGKVIETEEIYLGGVLSLNLVPVKRGGSSTDAFRALVARVAELEKWRASCLQFPSQVKEKK